MSGRVRIILLTAAMAAIYLLSSSGVELSAEELRAYNRVRDIQSKIWNSLSSLGAELSLENDPQRTGLIGVEWSIITTTLGPIEAKRTATDPLWAAWILRYFDSLGVKKGDPVLINASGSFPGMLLSALTACEERGVRLTLFSSMTSSTWGANRTDAPMPTLLKIMKDSGLNINPLLTIGGSKELGEELEDGAAELLTDAAHKEGFEMLKLNSLDEIVKFKLGVIAKENPKAILLIGGSVSSSAIEKSGVKALRLLNLKQLCEVAGIQYGGRFQPRFKPTLNAKSTFSAVAALVLFLAVLFTHKRWEWVERIKNGR